MSPARSTRQAGHEAVDDVRAIGVPGGGLGQVRGSTVPPVTFTWYQRGAAKPVVFPRRTVWRPTATRRRRCSCTGSASSAADLQGVEAVAARATARSARPRSASSWPRAAMNGPVKVESRDAVPVDVELVDGRRVSELPRGRRSSSGGPGGGVPACSRALRGQQRELPRRRRRTRRPGRSARRRTSGPC